MTLELYHSPISTCSQKVRLALAEKDLRFESRVLDMAGQEHLSRWYLALNPNGVVPTLVHDGLPVRDSSVICEYLDETFAEPALSPRSPIDRADMRAWMRYFEEVPTVAIRVPSFNQLFARPLKAMAKEDFEALTAKQPLRKHFYRELGDDGFSEAKTAEALERLSACLERVDQALSDGRPYLLEFGFSIADIVLVPTVVRMVDLGLQHLVARHENVASWFERIRARPSFDRAYYPGTRIDPDRWTVAYVPTSTIDDNRDRRPDLGARSAPDQGLD